MSYYAYINEKYVDSVGTLADWNAFCDWADTLDVKRFKEVVRLCEHHWVAQIKKFGKQLATAVESELVPDDLLPAAEVLLEAVKALDEDESGSILFVTDGADALANEFLHGGDSAKDSDDDGG